MTTLPSPEPLGDDAIARRPPTVDYAVYAIVTRSAFAVLSAFAAYLARAEFTAALAKANPTYSAAKVHDTVSGALRLNVLQTVIFTLLILLVAKFIRDGKGWARWVYVIMSLVVTGDVLRVTAFVSSGNLIYRICIGMTGLASIAAIALLFLRPSRAWFVRAGGGPLSLGSVFSPRASRTRQRAGAGGSAAEGSAAPLGTNTEPPPRRSSPPFPRAKSRRPGSE